MNHADLIQRLSDLRSDQEPEAPRSLLDAAFPDEWSSTETPRHRGLASSRSGAIAPRTDPGAQRLLPSLERAPASHRAPDRAPHRGWRPAGEPGPKSFHEPDAGVPR